MSLDSPHGIGPDDDLDEVVIDSPERWINKRGKYGVIIHWFWDTSEEPDVSAEMKDEYDWYAHESAIIYPDLPEKYGRTIFTSSPNYVPEQLVSDCRSKLFRIDADDLWARVDEFDTSELLGSRRRTIADGGDNPPGPIERLIKAGVVDRSEWRQLLSPYQLSELSNASYDEVILKIATTYRGIKLWPRKACLAVERSQRGCQQGLSNVSSDREYSGPVFTYSKRFNWRDHFKKLDPRQVEGFSPDLLNKDFVDYLFQPSAPVNLIWENTSGLRSAGAVAEQFRSLGWGRWIPTISFKRHTVLKDQSGISDHDPEEEETKGISLWNPSKQYHVRLFETKGTDDEYKVLGQAHCDPFDHNVFLDRRRLFDFDKVRNTIISQWVGSGAGFTHRHIRTLPKKNGPYFKSFDGRAAVIGR